jgi:copper(I)-binding protein
VLALLCSAPALAQGLAVSGAWIRLLPGDLPAAGYFVLRNDGEKAAKLVGASSPAFASAQLHETVDEHGLEKMVHVASVPVAAHASLRFRPGGYHIMLMHRRRGLEVGDTVEITLRLADGTKIAADFAVKGPAATGPG